MLLEVAQVTTICTPRRLATTAARARSDHHCSLHFIAWVQRQKAHAATAAAFEAPDVGGAAARHEAASAGDEHLVVGLGRRLCVLCLRVGGVLNAQRGPETAASRLTFVMTEARATVSSFRRIAMLPAVPRLRRSGSRARATRLPAHAGGWGAVRVKHSLTNQKSRQHAMR